MLFRSTNMVKKTNKKLSLNTSIVRKLREELTEEQLKQADGGRSGACSMEGCGTRLEDGGAGIC